ncbi:MAG: helix-turn-helix domain-containing protein [Vibrio toranzoniae]|uniref:helix-turn-helix domain-containing protein n=1 Tax=Vibrio toranzoniae TaxID=1194427 RepID=UPI003C4AE32E
MAQTKVAQNLRRIWDAKKSEMKFTQVQAAKELGWTQSAISHYLNNITDIGPQAIIKIANFLDVAPTDIDPDIVGQMPNVERIPILHNISDKSKKLNESVFYKNSQQPALIKVDKATTVFGTDIQIAKGLFLEIDMSEGFVPDWQENYFVCKLKKRTSFVVASLDNMPPSSQITAKYRLISIRF